MLDYLFRAPSIFAVREARTRFIQDDEILVSGAGYMHLENGDIWRRRRTRGVARQMHAWFFYYFLRPFHDVQDKAIARKLIKLLSAWRDIVELPPTRIPMAYHDEATAQRTIVLSCLLNDYGYLFSIADFELVHKVLAENAALLADEEFHSHSTNHGMYQDLALIVASKHLPNGNQFLDLGIRRLNEYFTSAFTLDGVHKEQSPQYHCIVSHHLREYADFLAPRDASMAEHLRKIFEKTETYATMAVTPSGKFPPVSDTANELVASLGYSHVYPSPEFQYAITQGVLGDIPVRNQYIASNTGVAIYREDWEDPNSVYLYFSSAYNSDYHKHSDELSLYLMHRGIDILREAGPNGYEMDDPYTVYAFSSFAHNTLIVNGEGLPRTDPESMNQVGLQAVLPEREEIDSDIRADFAVEGWNHRFTGVDHLRRVEFWKGEHQETPKCLTILDTVTSEQTNDYQLLWHFGEEISLELLDGTARLRDNTGVIVAQLTVSSNTDVELRIARGESEPKIQGWYFPDMGVCEPAQALLVSFRDDNAEIKTEISLV